MPKSGIWDANLGSISTKYLLNALAIDILSFRIQPFSSCWFWIFWFINYLFSDCPRFFDTFLLGWRNDDNSFHQFSKVFLYYFYISISSSIVGSMVFSEILNNLFFPLIDSFSPVLSQGRWFRYFRFALITGNDSLYIELKIFMNDEKYDSHALYSFKMDLSVSRIRSSYFVIMDSFTNLINW